MDPMGRSSDPKIPSVGGTEVLSSSSLTPDQNEIFRHQKTLHECMYSNADTMKYILLTHCEMWYHC